MEKEHKKIKNKNILIIGEGYCCGKTHLLNKIISEIENKEKVLFISKMDKLHKKIKK